MSAPREVLFRAKLYNIIGTGNWIEGSYASKCYTVGEVLLNNVIIDQYGEVWEIDRATLCQFTGREEVWENSIVDVTDDEGITRRGVVRYAIFFCSFYIDCGGVSLYRWMYYAVKVIGNIFDNPEMMEVEK